MIKTGTFFAILILFSVNISAQKPNWEIITTDGETILVGELISIGNELLTIKYQAYDSFVEIDNIISISKVGINTEREATIISFLAAVTTFGITAFNLGEPVDCGFLTNFCKMISIGKDLDKVLKTLIISSIVGGISYFTVKLSGRAMKDVLVLEGKSTFEKVTEINRFYAKHTPKKTIY